MSQLDNDLPGEQDEDSGCRRGFRIQDSGFRDENVRDADVNSLNPES
jgi:hypothetical protein